MDEPKRVKAFKEMEKSKISDPDKYKKTTDDITADESRARRTTNDRDYEMVEEERSTFFNDLRDLRSISWPGNALIETTAF